MPSRSDPLRPSKWTSSSAHAGGGGLAYRAPVTSIDNWSREGEAMPAEKSPDKIVITGVSGLIGFHLADRLCREHPSQEVVGIARSSRPEVEILLGHRNFRFAAADIVEGGDLGHIIPGAWLVYHLAARSGIFQARIDPVADLRANIQGTLNVLLASSQAGVRKLIFTSGGAVYQSQAYAREDIVGQPRSFYGASKLAAEGYVRLAGNALGMRYSILQAGTSVRSPHESWGRLRPGSGIPGTTPRQPVCLA